MKITAKTKQSERNLQRLVEAQTHGFTVLRDFSAVRGFSGLVGHSCVFCRLVVKGKQVDFYCCRYTAVPDDLCACENWVSYSLGITTTVGAGGVSAMLA